VPASRLTCCEFTALIRAYLDAELDKADYTLFEEHASGCKRCRDYLKGYESMAKLVRLSCRNLESADKASMPQSLLRRILNAAPKRSARS
jgi:predicted anti-sigma-YlaC factor YlaD